MEGTILRPAPGPIQKGVSYPLKDFQARSGLGTTGLRSARREGLQVRYVGGRGYVLGDDWIEFVSNSGKTSKAGG